MDYFMSLCWINTFILYQQKLDILFQHNTENMNLLYNIDGSVQDCGYSIVSAMGLPQYCTEALVSHKMKMIKTIGNHQYNGYQYEHLVVKPLVMLVISPQTEQHCTIQKSQI